MDRSIQGYSSGAVKWAAEVDATTYCLHFLLQLLPGSPDAARDACDGSGDHFARVEFGGSVGVDASSTLASMTRFCQTTIRAAGRTCRAAKFDTFNPPCRWRKSSITENCVYEDPQTLDGFYCARMRAIIASSC
jgi:hypothetical protein